MMKPKSGHFALNGEACDTSFPGYFNHDLNSIMHRTTGPRHLCLASSDSYTISSI